MKNYAGKLRKVHFKRAYINDNGRSVFEIGCCIQNQTYCYDWSYKSEEVTCKKCLRKMGVIK